MPDTVGPLLLIAETLAAGMAHGQLWFGTTANVGRVVDQAAEDLGVLVGVAGPFINRAGGYPIHGSLVLLRPERHHYGPRPG